jgi:hypothetical protein
MPFPRATFLVCRYATVAWITIAAGVATFDQRSGLVDTHGGYAHCTYLSGWPFVCMERYAPKPFFKIYPELPERRTIDMLAVVFDLGVFVAIVASSVLVAHRLRFLEESRQIHLAHMFVLVNVVAALAALLRHELDSLTRITAVIGGSLRSYYPITLYDWWVFVPVLCGVACFVVAVSSIVAASVRVVPRLVKRLHGMATKRPATRDVPSARSGRAANTPQPQGGSPPGGAGRGSVVD